MTGEAMIFILRRCLPGKRLSLPSKRSKGSVLLDSAKPGWFNNVSTPWNDLEVKNEKE